MKAKVLVRVDRDAALEAIRTLDALSAALEEQDTHWPRRLKRRYRQARDRLVQATGALAQRHGLAELTAFD